MRTKVLDWFSRVRLNVALGALLISISLLVCPSRAASSGPPMFTSADRTSLLRELRDPRLTREQRRAKLQSFASSRPGTLFADPAPKRVLTGCGTWSTLFANTPVPTVWGIVAIYDSLRDRLVVFGGINDDGHPTNDVWTLALGTLSWARLAPSGTPPSERYRYAAVYDPVRDRVLIFGDEFQPGLWALSLGGTPSWTALTPSGPPPPMFFEHSAIYDPTRDRVVLFGGTSSDVWMLNLSPTPMWAQLNTAGTPPTPRVALSAIYDGPRDRMILFGGTGKALMNDVWSLTFSGTPTWSQIVTGGMVPAARAYHAAIFDAPRNRMIVYAGRLELYYNTNEVWSLALSGSPTWTQLAPTGFLPPETEGVGALYDPVRERMVAFGGVGAHGDQLWALALSTTPAWTQLFPPGMPPRPRADHSTILDAPRNRLVMFAGEAANGDALGDLWTFDLSTNTYEVMAAGATQPERRTSHTAIFDAPRNRMILFGGVASYNNASPKLDDVWALALSGSPAWTKLSPSGTPPVGRSGHTAIFDAPRNRMIVFGGNDGTGNWDDVWALSLGSGNGTWTQLAPAGTPPSSHVGHSAIYDPVRDRMLVFGGQTYTGLDSLVWSLSFSGTPTWSVLTPLGAPPEFAYEHVAVYDPVHDRMLVSGNDADLSVSGYYELTLSGTPTWSRITPDGAAPQALYKQAAVWDGAANRLLIQGGGVNEVVAMGTPAGKYGLVTLSVPANGGTVIRDPDLNCYDDGSQVMLTATPATGYVFSGWSGAASGSANPLTVTMDADKNIYANFTGYSLNVEATPTASGTITKNPDQPTYVPGTQVTVTATPATGHEFSGWSGDASGAQNPLTITMDANKNVLANFAAACGVWSLYNPPGTRPTARDRHHAIYDPVRERMIVFGGIDYGPTVYVNDVWTLSLTGAPSWTLLAPAGSPPSGRMLAGVVYDPVRDRMIVIGGVNSGNLNDVWALSLSGSPTWTQLSPSGTKPTPRSQFKAIYDPVRDRIVLFGGDFGTYDQFSPLGNDVWALSLGASPAWSLVATSATKPSPRCGYAATYDPVRDRLVIYGGFTAGPVRTGETWALAFAGTPTWTQLPTASGIGTPNARYASEAVYDPGRDRLLVQGGLGMFGYLSDLYELTLAGTPAWSSLPTSSTPAGRLSSSLVWDAPRERLVLFGGYLGGGPPVNDAYVVNHDGYIVSVNVLPSGGGSVARSPDGACASGSMTLTAQPATGYAFSHWSGDASGSNNPITITVDSRKNVTANFVGYPITIASNPNGAGTVTKNPSQSTYAPGSTVTLTAAATVGLGYVFSSWSGHASGSTNPLTITMNAPKTITANYHTPLPSCGAWSRVFTPTEPAEASSAGAAYDALRHRMLLLGRDYYDNNSWVYALSLAGTASWTRLAPAGTAPSYRQNAGVVYDPVRDRLLVIGGTNFGGNFDEVWELSLAGSPTWTKILPAGTLPGARNAPGVVYDPVRDRILLFGGSVSGTDIRNDVWQLTLSGTPTWSALTPSGAPPAARYGLNTVYDPVRDRMIVYGGRNASSTFYDVSVLNLSSTSWEEFHPPGPAHPSPFLAAAAYDAVRDRIVFFGGYTGAAYSQATSVLSLKYGPAWISQPLLGPPPGERSGTATIYDPENDRLIVFGGHNQFGTRRTTFAWYSSGGSALDLWVEGPTPGSVTRSPDKPCYSGETVTLTALPVSGQSYFQGWSGDASGDTNPLQVVMDGNKVIRASFSPRSNAVVERAAKFELALLSANPSRGPTLIAYGLAYPARVKLTVLDVAGREVARLVDGVADAGSHMARWDAMTAGGPAPAGIYFARYHTPTRVWVRRFALLR